MENELKDALAAILKAELSPVLMGLDGIDSRLNGMDVRFDSIDARLGRIELEQAQIKQAVLETNEIVKRIELVQAQQHEIIVLLSARSIEHEAKLRRIL
ncbi:hypothetical protein AB4114_25020 [Paenibacillus sp. 2RAB27]|uniref:hypothetical protein n=1 Tax=Paenibacillus sp. 2RAB27 TaxID=3232991 RepID=UPI003F9C6C73